MHAKLLYGFDLLQAAGYLHYFARVDFLERDLTDQPFNIAALFYALNNTVSEVSFFYEEFNKVQSFVYSACIFQGKYDPALQHTGTHRRNRVVEHFVQRKSISIARSDEFKVAYGESVHPQIILAVDPLDRRYVL